MGFWSGSNDSGSSKRIDDYLARQREEKAAKEKRDKHNRDLAEKAAKERAADLAKAKAIEQKRRDDATIRRAKANAPERWF